MGFNPLTERGIPLEKQLRNWSELNVEPYDKDAVHPFTRCRVILMNGIEVEAAMFSHQFARHTRNIDLKRMLAMTRRVEQQQQKTVNWLTPAQESTLEVTIGYEQVAVELTAWVAQNSRKPSGPWTRPNPLSRTPPKGSCGIAKCSKQSLMTTPPVRSCSARRRAFRTFPDQRLAANP